MIGTIRREISDLGWLIRTLTLAAIAGAVYMELRKPPEERTWHGRLVGFVPYDFRMPTPRRVLDAYWNPSSGQLLTEQPFGVGWGVNIPVAVAVLQRIAGQKAAPPKRAKRAGTEG
jgi:hypothetical protein